MTGTTTRGLPFPDPTDPLAEGADAIKNLALAADAALPVGMPSGAYGIIGAFDASRPVIPYAFRVSTNTNGVGLATVPLPAGVSCLLAVTAIPDGQGTPVMLTLDPTNCSLTQVVFQLLAPGGAIINTGVGLSVIAYLQFGGAIVLDPAQP